MTTIKENIIYAKVELNPRIFGITFNSLLIAMGVLLGGLILCNMLISGFLSIVIGIIPFGAFIVYARWHDNLDPIEEAAKKIPFRKVIAAYSMTSQKVNFI